MPDFEFIEHTADVGMRVFGQSFEALFENSARALFQLLVKINPSKNVKKSVALETQTLEELLVNWLNELIFYVDAENMFFSKFNVKVDEKQYKLFAECKGDFMGSQSIEFFPSKELKNKRLRLDIGTAGSIGLVLPAMAICYGLAGTLEFAAGGFLAGKGSGVLIAVLVLMMLGMMLNFLVIQLVSIGYGILQQMELYK